MVQVRERRFCGEMIETHGYTKDASARCTLSSHIMDAFSTHPKTTANQQSATRGVRLIINVWFKEQTPPRAQTCASIYTLVVSTILKSQNQFVTKNRSNYKALYSFSSLQTHTHTHIQIRNRAPHLDIMHAAAVPRAEEYGYPSRIILRFAHTYEHAQLRGKLPYGKTSSAAPHYTQTHTHTHICIIRDKKTRWRTAWTSTASAPCSIFAHISHKTLYIYIGRPTLGTPRPSHYYYYMHKRRAQMSSMYADGAQFFFLPRHHYHAPNRNGAFPVPARPTLDSASHSRRSIRFLLFVCTSCAYTNEYRYAWER